MDDTLSKEFPSIVELVKFRANRFSGSAQQPAFTYLADGETVSRTLTFAELDYEASALASRLAKVVKPGERVVLVFPPGLDFVVAFVACMYAGAIAVPALPPSNLRQRPRLRLIVADSGARVGLALSATRGALIQEDPTDDDAALRRVLWLASDEDSSPGPVDVLPMPEPDHLAFLQYTSGSTGDPKGVMVSHRNLLANLLHSKLTYGVRPDDVFVSWLPAHHDFGLIGAICLPLYMGCHCVQFPASAFLMRPFRWLKLISDYAGSVTGAPNFAYQLCAERITEEQKQALDLSKLRIAVNGAERVRAETMTGFAKAFRVCGLNPAALTPAYGMAESVLLVTANVSNAVPRLPPFRHFDKSSLDEGFAREAQQGGDCITLAASGMAKSPRHSVMVVDPATGKSKPDGRIGELWLQGPSVAGGYWNRQNLSQKVFTAIPEEEGCWLRTGDLGFVHEGELYLTGRLKELLIIAGRNIYPQDIEQTVEHVSPAFRANACVAFTTGSDSVPALVIVQELEARNRFDPDLVCSEVRLALAECHDIHHVAAVLFVKAGRIPRTSSGKLQRLRCKRLFESGDIEAVWTWRLADQTVPIAPHGGSAVQDELLDIWKRLFEREDVSVDDNFFQLGGHSLLATQIIASVRERFGCELGLRTLFDTPTVAGLAQAIVAASGGATPADADTYPTWDGNVLPLTYAQKRFWFLDKMRGDKERYSIPLVLTFQGPLAAEVLEAAIGKVVERHAPLRATFPSRDGVPAQQILPAVFIALERGSLEHLAKDRLDEHVRREVKDEAQIPFDLAAGPMLRARLLREHDQRHHLLLTVHHIALDGASVGMVLNEVAQAYCALLAGHSVQTEPLTLQYAQYVLWEERRFQRDAAAADLEFWRANLAGASPLLSLPLDRPRRPRGGEHGASHQFRIGSELTLGLQALAREQGVSLFTVLAAAMQACLYRYTSQTDFCLGSFSANRGPQAQHLVGNFINVVPLRARVEGNQSFAQLVRATATNLFDVYDHQIPFELILNELVPQRDTSYTPFAQVVMNYHNELGVIESGVPWPPGLTAQVSRLPAADIEHAEFDVKLEIHQLNGGIDLVWEYDSALFDAGTIDAWAANYVQLLASACDDPQARVADLELLAPGQREALPAPADCPEVDPAIDIIALLEAQAQRSADRTALVCGETRLSYARLHQRADKLASRLRSLGVSRNTLVGVCAERSVEMVVGLLAVWKAGGAYVPLDPSYPPARLGYMLDDARPQVLLTQQRLLGRIPAHAGVTLCVDGEAAGATWHDGHVRPVCAPDDLAYVIYTSGSTGKPKGTQVQRRGVSNLLQWFVGHFELGAADKTLLFSSLSFDLTQKNIWAPLLVGGELHLPGEGYDPDSARACIAQAGISLLNCAPSAFYPLIEEGGAHRMPSLRHVFLGGEPVQAMLIHHAYRDTAQAPQVHNTYGPTEASDVVSAFSWDPRQGRQTLPIGRPLPNTRFYLLDANGKLVPRGAVGELYIGGAGVGPGYLGLPELTAQRFLAEPFGGGTMYRTGDMVRVLADGNLEYVGRTDHQVKVRGFRIELGEIEAALAAVAPISSALALVREEGDGARIVAYVVPAQPGQRFGPGELREQLAGLLPHFMLPSAIVQLDSMPLTPNGKLDRQALPVPTQADVVRHAFEAPVSEVERQLAAIWQQVLGVDVVGRHDHFVELGGHSLALTKVRFLVKERFGVTIGAVQLYQFQQLHRLAGYIEERRVDNASRTTLSFDLEDEDVGEVLE